jgi:hypothetical protein
VTRHRPVLWIAGVGFVVCIVLFSDYWWAFALGGFILVGLSFLPSMFSSSNSQTRALTVHSAQKRGTVMPPTGFSAHAKEDYMSDPKLMELLQSWDEKRLAMLFGRIEADDNLVLFYFNEVFARFIIGQESKTFEKRLAFCAQQNTFLRTFIENKELTGKLGLIYWEQLTAAKRARSESERVDDEDELARLRLEAEKEKARLDLAEARKKIADLSKPSSSSGTGSTEQVRAAKKAEADEKAERIREEKRRVERNPTFNEDERVLKLNDLDDKLAAAEEEAAKYI